MTNGATFITADPFSIHFNDADPTYKAGLYEFNLVINLVAEGFTITNFPMNLIINPLVNAAPTLVNVDCANFELEFELTYTC